MTKFAFVLLPFLAVNACNQGIHTGQVLKDCAGIPANSRQDAAREIKNLDRDTAIKTLAAKYSISETAAAECLK